MGTSNWQNISYCLQGIRDLQPRMVLDVGAGFGRWGFLCREFLDVWEVRTYPEKWEIQIDCVEVFSKNITPVHEYIYDHIWNMPAEELLAECPNDLYDLIIVGDVLEHFEKTDGWVFLLECIRVSNKAVLLNVPLGIHWPQGPRDGNTWEEHKSTWEMNEFWDLKEKAKILDLDYTLFKDYIGRDFASLFIRKVDHENSERNKKRIGMSPATVRRATSTPPIATSYWGPYSSFPLGPYIIHRTL